MEFSYKHSIQYITCEVCLHLLYVLAEVQVSFEQSVYGAVEGGTANVTVAVDGFFTVPFTVTVIPSNGTAIGTVLLHVYVCMCIPMCGSRHSQCRVLSLFLHDSQLISYPSLRSVYICILILLLMSRSTV